MSEGDALKPIKVKTPIEELEVLSELSNSVAFTILKRVVRRYVENLKTLSFSLREEDPHFSIKHVRYVEQAVGMELLIKIIADSSKEKSRIEEEGE